VEYSAANYRRDKINMYLILQMRAANITIGMQSIHRNILLWVTNEEEKRETEIKGKKKKTSSMRS
jgi:hypothetical protein